MFPINDASVFFVGGESAIAQGAQTLLKLRDTVDAASAGSPAALAVVTAVGNGYRRHDGVAVIPVAALGP